MLKKGVTAVSAAVLLALAVYGAHLWVQGARREAGDRALAQTTDWSNGASLAARLMVDAHGPPQWASESRLEWGAIPPWNRIVVRDSTSRFLEHAVSYPIPQDKVAALQDFGCGLIVDYKQGELAAQNESEETNLLCLNLAADIAAGKRTPLEASRFYQDTTLKSYAGKSSPYMERLLFPVTIPREEEIPLP